MKKVVVAALLAMLAFPVIAADQDPMETCKDYAKEDGVAAEDMEEYLENCMKDLKEAEGSAKD